MPAVWETTPAQPIKVAVCIPTRGWVKTEFLTNFKYMHIPEPFTILMDKYNPIDVSRGALAYQAVEKLNAERVFFLDDDVLPPSNVIDVLIQMQDYLMNQPDDQLNDKGEPINPRQPSGFKKYGPVVSGMYWAKKVDKSGKFLNAHACAWRRSFADPNNQFSPINAQTFDGDMIECDVVGAGCMLVHRSVFEKLEKPWFKWNVNLPTPLPPGEAPVSEDFFFNLRAASLLGVKPVVMRKLVCQHLADAKVDMDGSLTLSTI